MSVVLEKKKKVREPYLEEHAKTYIDFEKKDEKKVLESGESYCGKYAKVGECENGHQWIKVIYCGKEWCGNCREITHNRRIARWLPKALTMQSFGYFVFTLPLEVREFYQEKKNLSQLRSYLRRRLKQIYPDLKALCRWHWFGDNPYLYHPHLNVMVSSFGRLPKKELERIKQDYRNALERFTGIKLSKKVDVYYHFYSVAGFRKEYEQEGKKLTGDKAQELYCKILWHKLRYITRPTFIVYQRELAEKLKNYRNSTVWGKFLEVSYEEVEKLAKQREAFSKVSQDVVMLGSGHCPICGGKIRWLKGLYPGSLACYGKELGNGYFWLQELPRASPGLNWERLKEELAWKKLFLTEQSENIKNWFEKEQRRKDIYG
ncbi:MAG: hypothetical protein J7M38_09685 [Armatimonadetes bacterium]|nr:hypothetical protein [Armatimonadota bacterium]